MVVVEVWGRAVLDADFGEVVGVVFGSGGAGGFASTVGWVGDKVGRAFGYACF